MLSYNLRAAYIHFNNKGGREAATVWSLCGGAHFTDDAAHSWLQCEVRSNRLKVRRDNGEHTAADGGSKALGRAVIARYAETWDWTRHVEHPAQQVPVRQQAVRWQHAGDAVRSSRSGCFGLAGHESVEGLGGESRQGHDIFQQDVLKKTKEVQTDERKFARAVRPTHDRVTCDSHRHNGPNQLEFESHILVRSQQGLQSWLS